MFGIRLTWLIAACVALGPFAGCGKKDREPAGGGTVAPAGGGARGKVLMVIAHEDFRDEELLKPMAALQAAGYSVVVASTSLDPATGMLGASVKPNVLLADAKAADYAAVVFVGGAGAPEYYDAPAAHAVARDAADQGKVIGAICLATGTLAKAGVIKGRKVTGWPSDAHEAAIKAGGAAYTGADVETDGRIVTARGPKAADAFGRALCEALAP